MSEEIIDSADIEFIDAKEAVFNLTENFILTLDYKGVHYPCVQLHRSFPFSNPEMYISVRDDDDSDKDKVREIGNDKKKEIGIIKDLKEYNQATRAILDKIVDLRYFAPNVIKIYSIKEEFGLRYWSVETDKGPCKFAGWCGRLDYLQELDKIWLYDLDGNRFIIDNYSKIDGKMKKQLELYM